MKDMSCLIDLRKLKMETNSEMDVINNMKPIEIFNKISDTDEEQQDINKNGKKKPRRAILLTGFVALLMFLTMIVNILCSFFMKLATNNEFMTQIMHIITQLKDVTRRSTSEFDMKYND